MKRPALTSATWRKSSRSNGSSNCVEIAGLRAGVGIRDSKAPGEPSLVVAPQWWAAFLDAVKAGGHDLA